MHLTAWQLTWRVTADRAARGMVLGHGHQLLDEAVRREGLNLTEAQQVALLAYMDLIGKWNQVYNLTAVREVANMLTHHLLDSLVVIAPLQRQISEYFPEALTVKLLDVGSGAGLPGVVIAICCPQVQVTCVDTVAKKTAFVRQVAVSLQLPNLRGLHARVEMIVEPHDVVCSRAFASLVDFARWSRAALAQRGVWMAMKGRQPIDEIDALPANVRVFHVEPLTVPGLDAQRCIVWMKKSPPTLA